MATLEEKAIQKRTVILSTTLNLISEKGFHGTPMSLIADEAGVGYGTIYRYFRNKEDLITELFREIKNEISDAMLRGYIKDESISRRYSKIVFNLIQYLINNSKKFKFIEQFAFSPFINKKARDDIEMNIHKPIMDLFEEGIIKSEFKKIPYELMISLTYGTVSFLVNLHVDNRYDLSDDKNISQAVEACWHAVKG